MMEIIIQDSNQFRKNLAEFIRKENYDCPEHTIKVINTENVNNGDITQLKITYEFYLWRTYQSTHTANMSFDNNDLARLAE